MVWPHYKRDMWVWPHSREIDQGNLTQYYRWVWPHSREIDQGNLTHYIQVRDIDSTQYIKWVGEVGVVFIWVGVTIMFLLVLVGVVSSYKPLPLQVSDLMRSPLEDTQSVNISPSQDGCGSLGGMASQRPVPLLIAGSKGQSQQALLMPAGGAAIGQGEPHALRGQEDRDPSPSAEEEAMRRDMNAHELNGKYVCPTCSKPFDRPYRLQRHLQIHNPNRPKVTCQLCDKSFTRVDTLENHMKCLHSTERPFKCTFSDCNKSFPLQSALIHHLKVCVLGWGWSKKGHLNAPL